MCYAGVVRGEEQSTAGEAVECLPRAGPIKQTSPVLENVYLGALEAACCPVSAWQWKSDADRDLEPR